jgi:NAD(P)-dependent dehydrogenase (short-subunit alcohol dehydrogenase family)
MSAGPVVIITGASSGFGRLTAETLAWKNYRVFATMRDAAGRNARAAGELRALAKRESLFLQVIEMDVNSEASVESAVATAVHQCRRVDVLINNAAYGMLGLAESYTLEQAQRIFDTNFLGAVRTNRAVLPHMRRQRSGLLIHVSSGGGRVAIPGMALYCATKFALEAFAETYRYELASQGIDSVILEPGAYPTGIAGKLEAGQDAQRNASYGALNSTPEKILAAVNASRADPQEIADAMVKIIETPAGQRPLRYRVGPGAGGVQRINALTDEVQAQMLKAFGLEDLTKFRSSAGGAS